jgi:hypothetical protein
MIKSAWQRYGVEIFQPTPIPPVCIRRVLVGHDRRRPAGLVDFNDADSYKEVAANRQPTAESY